MGCCRVVPSAGPGVARTASPRLRNDYRAEGASASAIVLRAVKGAGIGQRTIDELGAALVADYREAHHPAALQPR